MVLRLSHKKKLTLCALIVLGAFISGVKCIGESCSSSSDCKYSAERCCRQTSVGICHFKTTPCLGDFCLSNSECPRNSVCCGRHCVPGKSCIGRFCERQSDCGFDESCCNDLCVYGKHCHRQGCTYDSDCSGGQACCSQKCTNGTNCIGRYCSKESDCQTSESCCAGTCKGSDCNLPGLPVYIIIGVTAACVVTVIAVIVILSYFYNRRRQQRLMAFSNVPFGHLAESTTSHLPQLVNNTFQQPPPEYTASITPAQYTLTSSNGYSEMNTTPKASVTSPHPQ